VHRPRRRRGGASMPPAHGPRGPRWRRLHQPRPRRPRRAAAAPARGSHGRADVAPNPRDARSGGVSISRARAGPPRSRRPGERRRHPPPPAGAAARTGVADSDRSQSQDGPLASGPKSSCTAVVAGRGLRGASQIGSGTGTRFPSVLRGSLLLRASHRTHVRHVAGQASWVGPNAVLSPLWTQASEGGNLEAAGLVHLAPGSVPTPSRVPSELRPAKGATKGRPC